MGQLEVYNLLKKKGEMRSEEIDKNLQGICEPKAIDHALRVMKKHNEITIKVKGYREVYYSLK